jgi:hypothetical protein
VGGSSSKGAAFGFLGSENARQMQAPLCDFRGTLQHWLNSFLYVSENLGRDVCWVSLVVFAPFGSYHVDVLERLAIDALN